MNIRQMVIDYELDQMSRYLDLVQESLQRNHDHLEARFVEMTGEVTNSASECVGSSSDDYEDEFFEATQDFPQLLRLSFIVIWYAFVEKNLLDLCEELNLTVSVGAKENDNLDKGIRRARKFLVRAKNYEIDADHWQELIEINRLRNHIVHDGKRLRYSYLKPDGQFVRYENIGGTVVFLMVNEALYSYLQKHGIATTSGPFIEIVPSIEYCKSLVEFGRKLFRKLYVDLTPIHQTATAPAFANHGPTGFQEHGTSGKS